ncbi:MAG: Polyphenol oxidase [Syntrophus sp. SKADARSKE-3]|nr:Polyphenol oxidase [Syntrophus sp. SKADARSKE-3]
MYTLTQRGDITCLTAPSLSELDFLSHAFCTRVGGVSKGPFAGLNISPLEGDEPENVCENWRLLSQAFGIAKDHFFLLRQVHGDGILVLDRPLPMAPAAADLCEPPPYDAVITDQPGLALCIKTADCVPIFLVDPVNRVIANVHAGWKGTALGIARRVVTAMTERFGSKPGLILAAIGPAIGPCCYEVDEPVIRAMGQGMGCRPSLTHDRWMLDLPLINRHLLCEAGLAGEHISSVNLCTSCRKDLFFSHRRDRGRTGRQVHFLMLNEQVPIQAGIKTPN